MRDAATALREAEVGTESAGRSCTLSLARVLAFSGGPLDEPGWPQRNLHTDIDKAREAGLDHIIASGTQSEGLLVAFLLETFGAAWYGAGHLELRFVKPVRVGDTVTPHLRWSAMQREADRVHLTAECWCEIGDGTRVIDGIATCTVAVSPHEGSDA